MNWNIGLFMIYTNLLIGQNGIEQDSIKDPRSGSVKDAYANEFIDKTKMPSIKDNGFFLQTGLIWLAPAKSMVHIQQTKQSADDYYYDLNITPEKTFGYFLNAGYQFKLYKRRRNCLIIPVSTSYYNFTEKNRQSGEYSGGFVNADFKGNRTIVSRYQFVNVITGIGVKHDLDKRNAVTFELLSAFQMAFHIDRKTDEIPMNCSYCKEKHESVSYNDFYSFMSISGKIGYEYSFGKIGIGPIISYSHNFIRSKNLFTNSYTNLNYYNFLMLGIKLKAL